MASREIFMEILVCASDYFRIEYEINPWMDVSNNADRSEVLIQYRKLLDTFARAGVKFHGIEPNPKFPDMVYTANYGFITGKKFIKANFKYEQRRGESALAEKYFRQLGYKIYALPDKIYFEGEGDLLSSGNTYFVGWGKRTMKEVVPHLKDILNGEVIDLELVDPYYYHLDTCFAPLNEKTVVINPNSFTKRGIEKIHNHFTNVILTSEQDNKVLACNMVVCGKNIIVGEGVSTKFKTDLFSYGYHIFETPMSQYIKGGGGVKCCSLIINNAA
ncbi:MAG TPA: arginine deiminase-related protein [Cytophagaceae bacterium]|jgi:N-dimethylarginine dimethylaminohydrolase|nr:arginine deiminase-related protein [Cytophagaceae bacterium]